MPDDDLPIELPDSGTAATTPATSTQSLRKISSTDVSQFIRLEQCQRYLRLRLHEREHGRGFSEEYGVHPETIPPLLTRSGQSFEEKVQAEVSRYYPTRNLASEFSERRVSDNDLVVELARTLPPGHVLVLVQARLSLPLGRWWFRGDIDILRMERYEDGTLHLLIADMKSSAEARMEHRLQVAFYHRMLSTLLECEGIEHGEISMGILYRGAALPTDRVDHDELARIAEQRALAEQLFGVDDALLEIAPDLAPYLDSVEDLVTGPDSTALRLLNAPFEELPYYLSDKCDGCLYNEYCMKWTAERDDLSLVPHLTALEKEALRRKGVVTVFDLAELKQLLYEGTHFDGLVPSPGKEKLTRQLSGQWRVGRRLDELILRARRYLDWKRYEVEAVPYIPSKGHGSLPYCDPNHNPNLVKISADAQHDYLQDRVYLLGSLVVAHEGGIEKAEHRTVARMAAGPPETDEEERTLLIDWIVETLGHSQISLTMDTYFHVIPALQRDAADRMDALLSER